jgi:hypothetical protein
VDDKWKCVANLNVDVLPISDDLTNIPSEDISLHELACVDENANYILCQPAGNAKSHSDETALHCDKHLEITGFWEKIYFFALKKSAFP